MFDRISRLAEQTANGISRRSFLTRFGLAAVGVTALLGAKDKPPPPPQYKCILAPEGSCCSGTFPYLRTHLDGTPICCCKDAQCKQGVICAHSACCNGGGYCHFGIHCKADVACNIPC